MSEEPEPKPSKAAARRLAPRQGRADGPFAGYEMPVQYEGILAEHEWTRIHAGLFDVSHMGQLMVSGEGAAERSKRCSRPTSPRSSPAASAIRCCSPKTAASSTT